MTLDQLLNDDRTPLLNTPANALAKDQNSERKEIWLILKTAVPLALINLSRFAMLGVTVFTVGHLGTKELAAASLASMHATVVGISVISGMGTSLDTLSTQAAGSSTPTLASLYALRQCIVSLTAMPAICLLTWHGSDIVHILSPQADPQMLALARAYLYIIVWTMPVNAITDCMRRFSNSIGQFQGPAVAIAIGTPVSIALNILLVHGPERIRLGFIGAPIAAVIANYTIFFILLGYTMIATPRSKWCGFSKAAFEDLGTSYRYSFAGIFAVCSEWWAIEAVAFGSPYLGAVTQASTAIYCSILFLVSRIPQGISQATSVRVGNLVGAGKSLRAQIATSAAQKIALAVVGFFAASMLLFRASLAKLYTKDDEVSRVVANNILLLVIAVIADGLQSVNTGILRAVGLSKITAQVNTIVYWGIGLWISLGLTYFYRTFGSLWSGWTVSVTLTQLVIRYQIRSIDWEKQADLAEARLAHTRLVAHVPFVTSSGTGIDEAEDN